MASYARRAARLSQGMPPHEALDTIGFDSGHAFPGILPDLVDAARVALSTYREESLQYAPRPGISELREWIAQFMRSDDADVTPDQVMVVNGAKQGLDLVCRLLLDEGDSVVVTAPTYYTAIPIFRSFGARFIEIGQDAEGLNVDELEQKLDRFLDEDARRPKLVYNVPEFHNPTGLTMSLARRQRLVEVAKRHGLLIVEDSPYRKIRFEGLELPPLKALDSAAVVSLGTFSKLIAPGLRIGWVAGSCDMIARMLQLKSDGGSCPVTQRLITEFLRAGQIAVHTDLVRTTYRRHRDRMVAALRAALPDASFVVPQGGYYLWLTLPAHVDGEALERAALERGVHILAGRRFFAESGGYPTNKGAPRNNIRLAFSHAGPEEIDEGVARLAEAYRTVA